MANHPKGGLAVIIGVGKPRRSGLPPVRGNELDPFEDPRQAAQRHAQRQRQAADIEAAFTGRPQKYGTYDEGSEDRAAPEQAGYMELAGARKGGDCHLVDVPGGVSPLRGCCDLFAPVPGASLFNCGHCQHFEPAGPQAPDTVPAGRGRAGSPEAGVAGTDLEMSA